MTVAFFLLPSYRACRKIRFIYAAGKIEEAKSIMKKFLLIASVLLFLGFVSGWLATSLYHGDETYLDSVGGNGVQYFCLMSLMYPGVTLTWHIFNPPDGYPGDLWDNRFHIVLLNGLGWMIVGVLATSGHQVAWFLFRLVRQRFIRSSKTPLLR
jgi:hypothetical protein